MDRSTRRTQDSTNRSNTLRRSSFSHGENHNAQNGPRLASSSRISRNNSDTLELSRATAAEHYSHERKKNKVKKYAKIAGISLVSVLVLAAVAIALYISNLSNKLNSGIDSALRNQLAQTEAGEPFYMLLLGVDKSNIRANVLHEGNSYHAYRSDSIILMRVDPKTPKLTMISIHRDTLVNLGSHGKQKINAAYAIGGPTYITQVVSQFAGVPISHYAEVDFDSFMKVIDELGGVEVNLPIEVKDLKYAEGDLKPGVQTLSSKDALFLSRARHAYDAYGDGDRYRAANQRLIITAILKKLLKSDPATMTKVISECAENVTTDMSVTDILSLAMHMRHLDTSKDIYSGMNPTESKYVNKTWYEISDTPKWQAMMKRVNEGLPPYEHGNGDPAVQNVTAQIVGNESKKQEGFTEDYSGSVTVVNASGIAGRARKMADTLAAKGYKTNAVSGNNRNDSLIIYNGPNAQNKAKTIQKMLGPSFAIVQNNGAFTTDTDVVVIIGKNYKG